MAIRRTDIIRALEHLIENEAGFEFQSLAVILTKQKWPDLVATERHKDGGLDAYARASLADDRLGKGVASSLTATITKVKGDAATAKENYPDLEILIFVTPHKVSVPTVKKWEAAVLKETGISLQVISREDILTSLMLPENAALCRTLPGLEASIESDGAELLERVQAALSEEITQWKTRQRVRDRPIITLQAQKLDAAGKETTDILQLDDILAALRQSRRVALEAPGGGGKTTTLVELAGRAPSDTELLFLVDLPAWILTGGDLLEFIARGPSFRTRNITAGDLARLARQIHFSFLLNGWNEITELHSPNAIAALDSLERNFPASGILVATRTHHVSPPLAGAIRLKLHSVTRQQRNDYLRSVLGARADELRLQIAASRILDGLTRTPLILSEVATIFQSGAAVPTTRIGILGAVVDLIENAPTHRAQLQTSLVGGHAEHYLSALAASMTGRGQVLVPAAAARAAMRGASNDLLVAEQISAPADPDAVLHILTSHHVLEQVDYPSHSYRFQHQRFQEYYASRYLLRQLAERYEQSQSRSDLGLSATYIDKPAWGDPLLMVAEALAAMVADGPGESAALQQVVRLLRLALRVDPIIAGDLAYHAGPDAWNGVRDEFSVVLRSWYSVDDIHHKHLALAAMMATGAADFADIFIPLLSDERREVRINTYITGDAFYPSCLGPQWRTLVEAWSEDARADFVQEVTHRGRYAEIGEYFASRDPSTQVRIQAVRELCWISANEALERIIDGLSDGSLDEVSSAFWPEAVPSASKERIIASARRLAQAEAAPLDRLRRWLRASEFGDLATIQELKTELNALAFPVDQYGFEAIAGALKLIAPEEPLWASAWTTDRLLDGSITGKRWIPFLRSAPAAQCRAIIGAQASRVFSYVEASGARAVLSASATPEIVGYLFDELCRLKRAEGTGPADIRQYFNQLRDVFRAIPDETGAAGLLLSLQGEFDATQFRVVVDLLGSVNPGADELRSSLSPAVRVALRAYLKSGIAELLEKDLFGNEVRSESAIALGRMGEPGDLTDIERLIAADIAMPRQGGTYANWYLLGVAYLETPEIEDTYLRLMRDEQYGQFAVRSLLQLALLASTDTPSFGRGTDFEVVWAARSGVPTRGLDVPRARRYAGHVRDCMAEWERDAAGSTNAVRAVSRMKDFAVILAVLDGRDFADIVMRVLALPGRWDAHLRMAGVRALLTSGAILSLERMREVLDPAIDHAIEQGLSRDQSPITDCLSLLSFADDAAGGIARIREVVALFRYRPYQFRDLVRSLGHSRSEAALAFLLEVARHQEGVKNFDTVWLEAIATLAFPTARQALLSFVDPAIPSIGVTFDFDFQSTELYASLVSGWAKTDAGLLQRLLNLSMEQLTPDQTRLLSAIYGELHNDATANVVMNLFRRGSLLSLGRGLEAQFVEREPTGQPYTSNLVPRNAERLRAEFFDALVNDPERRKDAFSVLGQVEVWRQEYGRPIGEPRHPHIASGHPWPPLELLSTRPANPVG